MIRLSRGTWFTCISIDLGICFFIITNSAHSTVITIVTSRVWGLSIGARITLIMLAVTRKPYKTILASVWWFIFDYELPWTTIYFGWPTCGSVTWSSCGSSCGSTNRPSCGVSCGFICGSVSWVRCGIGCWNRGRARCGIGCWNGGRAGCGIGCWSGGRARCGIGCWSGGRGQSHGVGALRLRTVYLPRGAIYTSIHLYRWWCVISSVASRTWLASSMRCIGDCSVTAHVTFPSRTVTNWSWKTVTTLFQKSRGCFVVIVLSRAACSWCWRWGNGCSDWAKDAYSLMDVSTLH